MAKTKREIEVAALRHRDKRRNIPTAELEAVMEEKERPRSASPTSAEIAISTRNSSGAAKMIRIGQT